jgi:ABC-type amino acid transport system permease subunit
MADEVNLQLEVAKLREERNMLQMKLDHEKRRPVMDSDARFWVWVWGVVGAVIITLILSVAYNNVQSNQLIASAIKSGADPIDAKCAFEGNTTQVCLNRSTVVKR